MSVATPLAPIVLFAYNRQQSTRQTVEALRRNELASQSELYIYSDGPKNPQDTEKVDAVRHYLKSIEGFKKVTIVERDRNWGLARNIVDGVTKVVDEFGKIVVLEDDLLTSSNFLLYMNESLDKYHSHPDVYSISGYSFTDDVPYVDSTYFLSMTNSWGWATWANKWRNFDKTPHALLEKLKDTEYKRRFDFNDCYNFSKLVALDETGEVNSWAVFWYASVLERGGLTLYPAKRLVRNIGFDGSGTNCGNSGDERDLALYHYQLTDEIAEKRRNRLAVERGLLARRPPCLRKYHTETKDRMYKALSPRLKTHLSHSSNLVKNVFSKKSIGHHSFVAKTVHVTGWNSVQIGHHSVVSEGTWLNVNNRTTGQKRIMIGNNCYIGFRNFFTSGKRIDIGDFVTTGIDCKFLGSDHVIDDPFAPYITTGTTSDSVIKIGVNVWMGAGVIVLGDVSIGHGSVIGAGALVTKSIPPFCVAFGNPCKIVKRFNLVTNEWVPIDQFGAELEDKIPPEDQYLERLVKDFPEISIPLQAASRSFGDIF
jgi:acetyltransferase-like isoleucine patch superfamily enzyme